jgi:hypothetical protein
MADFGIQKGHLKSLKQKFEKLQPPPKPPKPKHLSRPASMISIQNRISFYEENPFLDVPLIHSKSKSDSAVNVEFPEIPFIEVEPVASVQSPDVPVKRVMQRNEQVTIQADQQKVITTPNVLDEKQQKRALVVQEIRDTEKSYLQDLIVLKQVYVEPGYEIFPLETIKLLFGNLDQVIQVSNELTSMLDQYPDFIGDCFLQLVV